MISVAEKIDNHGFKENIRKPAQHSRNRYRTGYVVIVEGVVHIPMDHVEDSLNPPRTFALHFPKVNRRLLDHLFTLVAETQNPALFRDTGFQ